MISRGQLKRSLALGTWDSDEESIDARAGEDAAEDGPTTSFESIYAAEASKLAAAIALMAGSRQVAEETVAEAFVRALERWPRVSAMESPVGWIYRVAVNILHRRWRREALERRLLRRVPVADPQVIEIDPDLWAAVGSLPPRARAAVSLRYIGDLTERQVAEVLGVSPGTVAASLHQARRRLAAQIARGTTSDKTDKEEHDDVCEPYVDER